MCLVPSARWPPSYRPRFSSSCRRYIRRRVIKHHQQRSLSHRKVYLSHKHLRQPKPAAYELPQYRRHVGDVQVCFRSCTCRRREKKNRACDQSCHLHPYLCLTMLTIRSQQQTRTAHATAENLALDPNSYWAIQMWLPKSCPPMPTMDTSNACTSQTIRPLSLSSPSRIPRPARC